jgi:zinc protease
MEIIDFVWGGSNKSRLLERLRQKEGLSYGARSMMDSDAFDKNSLLLSFAICASPNAAKAMAAMLEELDSLVHKGVPDGELKDAKEAYKAQWDTQLASDDAVASLLEESLSVGRKLDYYDKLMAAVQALTPSQVSSTIARYVKPDGFVKVKAGDIKN